MATLVAGCGSKTPRVAIPRTSASGGQATTGGGSAAAHVGATLTLDSPGGGSLTGAEKLAITVTRVYDPATAASELDAPQPGKRLVAVNLSVQNLASRPIPQYDPDTEVSVIDTANQTYEFGLGRAVECQHLPSSIDLSPGETTAGCEVFQLPVSTKVGKVRFTPRAGSSPVSGTWLVP